MLSRFFSFLPALRRGSAVQRGILALVLACISSLALGVFAASERARNATAELNSAAERLDSLTDAGPADTTRRAAIAWGYAERLRLGLESPFRLIESSARDPRLTVGERRTVSWAMLGRVMNGETHEIDPATLDGIGIVEGERHLALITRAVGAGGDARAGELGVRIAYTLAATERIVENAALPVVAGVAALVADRVIAQREARTVVRAESDPIASIADRRAQRSFYLERPTLFASNHRVDGAAVEIAGWLLDSLRAPAPAPAVVADSALVPDTSDIDLVPRLYQAGARMPPSAPLVVTVKRYLPVLRGYARRTGTVSIERARNPEMLAAALATTHGTRSERRVIGRMLVSSAVALRSQAQDPIWFPGDSVPAAADVAVALGVAGIAFDADVPKSWRPYFVQQLADGVGNLRRVLPALDMAALHIRFRMTSPADSALAMHDPRTRTLHLPVLTAGGTLTHELAHELDRQVAVRQGHPGYRSDFVTRNSARERSRRSSSSVSASLRALTEEVMDAPSRVVDRPAEIFATQVDWFVARALASRGVSSGFLTAVQDEVLTGHVVHPERLRSGSRARPLLEALRGMTTVAPFAAAEREPSIHELLRWSLSGPVDRESAAAIVSGTSNAWSPPRLEGVGGECAVGDGPLVPRVQLVRMAAESRARGWLRLRARESGIGVRATAWSRAVTGQGPWAPETAERRAAQLRDHILTELATASLLPSGIGAVAAPLAAQARCL